MSTALLSLPLIQRVLLGLGILCATSWAAAAEKTPWPQAPPPFLPVAGPPGEAVVAPATVTWEEFITTATVEGD